MRSLFLKIFLWFWATQILIGIALSLLAVATARGSDQQALNFIGGFLESRAQEAASVYEADGTPSLTALRENWNFSPRGFRRRRNVGNNRLNSNSSSEAANNGGSAKNSTGTTPKGSSDSTTLNRNTEQPSQNRSAADPPDGDGPNNRDGGRDGGEPEPGDPGDGPGGPGDGPGGPEPPMGFGGPPDDNQPPMDFGERDNGERRGRGPRFGRGGGPNDWSGATFYALTGKGSTFKPERLAGIGTSEVPATITPTTFTDNQALFKQSDGTTVLARRVTSARGNQYMAIVPVSSGRTGQPWYAWFWYGPGGAWRIVVIAFTMGLVCYALARYLTEPAVKLRLATQELASGNLSVRVAKQMGSRRDELADLGYDFDVMAERIENLLLSERRLLGDISHELRSPLARMQVALDLADQVADDTTRTYLARIEDEAKELNVMINQLLTITRLENASPNDQLAEMVDLEQLVAQVTDNADFEAKSHGSKVELIEKMPCSLRGNGQLLRSAIENVVRNAILHAPTPEGIQISLHAFADVVKIQVRDHGPGVPPESLSELFRPFYRVAYARDRQSGGVGLGLSITQRAVQLHGGKVVATNAHDGGLMVEITLPVTVK